MKDLIELRKRIELACRWLVDAAQVKDKNLRPEQNPRGIVHDNWQGAIRGEYAVASKQWNTFCPMWHTGQALKALVMAWRITGDDSLLDAAKLAAQFIESNRISDECHKDFGLLCCYEGTPGESNSSAILETIDGLFYLADAAKQSFYQDYAIDALRWLQRKSYKPGKGLFKDFYYPATGQWYIPESVKSSYENGRPLLDDAMFLKGWLVTNDENFRTIAIETAERLLKDESPSGNWSQYGPCVKARGVIHPRHAYWWGMPMLEVYKATDDERFLWCFYRSVEWYKQALRKDGGFIRNTYTDFNTDSFGHATSGTACAVICFIKYYEFTGDKKILEYIERGLDYCMKMQFTNPEDPNLKGVILEKILPPDGTDRSPYHIRDLGTIFFIQAACLYLKAVKHAEMQSSEILQPAFA